MIIYTTEIIRSENKCGVTGDRYCIAEERLFKESKQFNNCLYKKIGIDKYGFARIVERIPSIRPIFIQNHLNADIIPKNNI
jgi:hypothetical protein